MPRQAATAAAQAIVHSAQKGRYPPIETAPREPERTLLLWCPEQGGWHTGEWFDGRWLSSADLTTVLEPFYWTSEPEEPALS